jgi:ABC-type spermidine/putrescine transport system permease subunit I
MRESPRAESSSAPLLLLAPGCMIFFVFLVAPLTKLLGESFRTYISGRIGSAVDAPLTLQNYSDLLTPGYYPYFADTFRLGLIATLVALITGYLLALIIARQRSAAARKLWLMFLVGVLFLSPIIRIYAISLALGPVGILHYITGLTGLNPNGPTVLESTVVAGLLSFLIPISAITLVGTIQNINPRLVEAAQALGAASWQAHLTITVPLSLRGILSAFLIDYTLSISAFAVPMILGRGRILFVSNLIYSRFGELANYPSGAALSIIMLVIALLVVYLMSRFARRRWDYI